MIAKRWRRLAAVGLTTVAVACSSSNGAESPAASPSGLPTGILRITTASATIELRVRIAETDDSRRKGLMGVRHLDQDAGMAFVFDEPVETGFWMKNTLIPLSIAFWDEQRRIVAIREMTPCHEIQCPLYSPGADYVGAVEANRGFFSAHDVRPGDQVNLIRG
jgi:uncharacterized membrane protein (UPF0127 family)